MLEPVDLERRPRELALMYSRRCNIACRHCGIESSPQVRGEMGMAAATRFIAESAAIPQFMKMTFTGGEPFIYQNEHLELLALCASLGLQTRIVTNGFWARDREKGLRLLERFKAAGLAELNFSADIFHLEFQKREILHNALSCAKELGFVRIVSFVTNDVTRPPLDQFADLYGFERSCLRDLRDYLDTPDVLAAAKDDYIFVYAGGLIALGRAAREVPEVLAFPVGMFPPNLACGEVVNKPVIYPDGAFQACCCAGGKIESFTVGNANSESIASLYATMERQARYRFVNSYGPVLLFRSVKEVNAALAAATSFSSICELCVRTFRAVDTDAIEAIAERELLRKTLEDLTRTRPDRVLPPNGELHA